MKGYLLDTSICVFLFRGNKNVEMKLNAIGYKNCFISDVVLAELRYGAYKSNRMEENLKMIDRFISKVSVIPFAESIDIYAREKARLVNMGKPLDDFDLLIGCAAKAARLTMVTNNIKHFSHIEGLEIEDWTL
ncbi:MAG: type II toxin-antitoxin system VapC family toxin [Bacteroidaceae bacterium]|nr:type II toxin-antitoxin system VapC family toxin [Bacteroidaceae bacterium]